MPAASSYPKGRAKREEILKVAFEAFSRGEGASTTLADIAKAAGVTRSTLLYHFNSREELFAEVVRWRDEVDRERRAPTGRLLSSYAELARHNAQVPGLVHLFTTVSAEATAPNHIGHEFFSERYASLIRNLSAEIKAEQDAGKVTSSVDATTLARISVAVMDGLQLQWLYDDDFDMAAAVEALLGTLFERPAPRDE